MSHPRFKLISHKLCPYVQRAVIVLKEKGISFERGQRLEDNLPSGPYFTGETFSLVDALVRFLARRDSILGNLARVAFSEQPHAMGF